MQSPDPQDSAEYEAWIRQRSDRQRSISLTSTSRFLEERYIDKEIDVPEMLQRKVPTAQTVHREQSRCIRCSLSTRLTNISVNRQRQVTRTGTAQWQDPGDVSCDATQFPMIQKMQKTVEVLQVQFIDKVVEISEIMQSRDKCQRSRRNGNSRKFTDRIVDVPVVQKRQCQPSAQVLDHVPTTGAQDAKRSERQSTSETDAKCKDKVSRERVVSGSRRKGARSA